MSNIKIQNSAEADATAREDIECNLPTVQQPEGGRVRTWYDTSDPEGKYSPWLPRAIQYLESRRLLIRNIDNTKLVRLLEAPSDAQKV